VGGIDRHRFRLAHRQGVAFPDAAALVSSPVAGAQFLGGVLVMEPQSSSAGPGTSAGDPTLRPLPGFLPAEHREIKVGPDPTLLVDAASEGRVRVEDAVAVGTVQM
jgi:hypothetical protein